MFCIFAKERLEVQLLIHYTRTSKKHLIKEKLGNKHLLTSLCGCVGSTAAGGKWGLLRVLNNIDFLEDTYCIYLLH